VSEVRIVHAGDAIFHQGDRGDHAYVVETGRIELRLADRGEEIVLATRGPGELFGEMAILDDEPRSATAVALQDTRLLVIDREQLRVRIDAVDPVLRLCLQAILGHVRGTLRRLTGGLVEPTPPPSAPA